MHAALCRVLDYPQAGFSFAGSCIGKDPAGAGERIADALGPPPDRCQLGLVISGVSDGRDDRLLRKLHARIPGMESPLHWKSWQYIGTRLECNAAGMAMIDLPSEVGLGFGFEHGWSPVGPLARVTKAKGSHRF